MQNKYQYDAVDNILGITNAVDPTRGNTNGDKKLGGAFKHSYAYDDLNRLVYASGKAKQASYSMQMTFGRMSEPLTKVQKVDSTKTAQSYDFTYIASSLKEYLGKVYNIKHIHGKPLHPQTQGKIERYHRSMKNVIKLNHYFCPSELEKAIDEWVKYYNERRFHESLDNLTPRDVYLGQGEKIKKIREIIKQNSINKRISENKRMKLQHK